MDDDDYDSSGERGPGGQARMRSVGQTLSTWVGAVAATAVLVVMGSWFYHLGVRDAQQVPIIRASTQPVKIRPVDRGGEVTPHQNIDSYNAASVNVAEEPEIQLAPAAPAPREEDVAMAALKPEPKPASQILSVQTGTEALGVAEASDQIEEGAPEDEVVAALTPAQPAEGSPTARAEAPEPAPPAEAQPEPAQPVSSGNPYAPDYSPPVINRPPNLRVRMLAARVSAENSGVDLAKAAEGSPIKVQLQASPSRDVIMTSWERIRSEHSDLVSQKALVVGVTQSGGVTYYRLRLGPFKDRADATATCQALRGRGQDCIVSSGG